mmetsp:Transcript_16891/g.28089  ORF Transcript_16891/g.28089 Transcript_16891/m.28089 type:complete len:449 (-) Transcript_16891:1010-2356(-)|eukprot:CAMPEP_0119307036 /NCGR_PEP_ID=MMETSP1333-20130426/7645_1 /TAXON_ID=418940 /ORGANISM="Scyphosphaera apsteinii, Strain RCC1455" /LENGTH=448 /DNA_ID=CAMNT_0007310499 /DNA_START=81 /DNA_END=1427 /DNA_ORIENTATION=-
MPLKEGRKLAAKEPYVKKRMCYDASFKIKVVREALERPADNRIKPTCANYPGIEPCQLRKWIRHFEPHVLALRKRGAPREKSGATPRKRARTAAADAITSGATGKKARSTGISAVRAVSKRNKASGAADAESTDVQQALGNMNGFGMLTDEIWKVRYSMRSTARMSREGRDAAAQKATNQMAASGSAEEAAENESGDDEIGRHAEGGSVVEEEDDENDRGGDSERECIGSEDEGHTDDDLDLIEELNENQVEGEDDECAGTSRLCVPIRNDQGSSTYLRHIQARSMGRGSPSPPWVAPSSPLGEALSTMPHVASRRGMDTPHKHCEVDLQVLSEPQVSSTRTRRNTRARTEEAPQRIQQGGGLRPSSRAVSARRKYLDETRRNAEEVVTVTCSPRANHLHRHELRPARPAPQNVNGTLQAAPANTLSSEADELFSDWLSEVTTSEADS